MYLEPKIKILNLNWQPSIAIEDLPHRANFLRAIRDFFANAGVLEVDPPVLASAIGTDPNLQPFTVSGHNASYYLLTSPEFPMKRLLAAGSGPIYYLGKSFRQDEVGSKHNPEFTMLEWYRPNWQLNQLIAEIKQLLNKLLGTDDLIITTYKELFLQFFNFDPHTISVKELEQQVVNNQIDMVADTTSFVRADWLDLLFSHKIEKQIGLQNPIVVTDYPAESAMLAELKTNSCQQTVAARFEVFYQGLELANGYQELTCAATLTQRFADDLKIRRQRGLKSVEPDQKLLAAMQSGLPACSGVAIGVDRLLMLKLNKSSIRDVINFAWDTI